MEVRSVRTRVRVAFVGALAAAAILATAAAGDVPAAPQFLAPWTTEPGGVAAGVAIADFTGDGRSDVVYDTVTSDTGSGSEYSVFLLAQQQDGSLGAPQPVFTGSGAGASMALASADFDGDGRSDVAFVTAGGIEILRQATGGFAPPTLLAGTSGVTGIRAADLNGDGKADLVSWTDAWSNGTPGGSVAVELAPSFAPSMIEGSGTWVNDVAVGDVTGDGLPDVVTVRNQAHATSIDAQTSSGTFAPSPLATTGTPLAAAVGDVTGDGRPDLVVTSNDGGNGTTHTDVYAGPVTATSQPASSPEWDSPAHPQIADVNGDGRNDLLVATSGGPGQGTAVDLRLQGGDGTLGAANHLSEPLTAASLLQVATGDVNGDGKTDVAVADTYSGLVLFRQAGSDTTPPTTTITSAPPARTLATSATFTFTSSEAGGTFQCSLQGPDGGFGWTACASPASFSNLTPGRYQFAVRAVDAAGNTDPNYQSDLWTVEPPSTRPANDDFANASDLGGVTGGTNGDTSLATRQQGEPQIAGYAGGHSVWFTLTGDTTGVETLDTSGSQFDAIVGVYTGTSLTSLTPVASGEGTVSFTIRAGTTYRIQLDGNASQGLYSLGYSWGQSPTPPPPPPPPAPANDLFANAQTLTGASGQTTGTNAGASTEIGEPVPVSNASASVWYRWTAPSSGTATVDTAGSGFDTALGVYTGTSVSSLATVGTNDDANGTRQSAVTFTATAGTTYRIVVDGYSGSTGSITLNWRVAAPPPPPKTPANDAFASAQTISGSHGSVTGSSVGATRQAGEPKIAGNGGGASIWFRWTAPANGAAAINTYGSSFDTILGVYTGGSLSALKAVATNDDAGGVLQSRVTFTARAGTTYMIAVDGYSGASGSVKLSW